MRCRRPPNRPAMRVAPRSSDVRATPLNDSTPLSVRASTNCVTCAPRRRTKHRWRSEWHGLMIEHVLHGRSSGATDGVGVTWPWSSRSVTPRLTLAPDQFAGVVRETANERDGGRVCGGRDRHRPHRRDPDTAEFHARIRRGRRRWLGGYGAPSNGREGWRKTTTTRARCRRAAHPCHCPLSSPTSTSPVFRGASSWRTKPCWPTAPSGAVHLERSQRRPWPWSCCD